MQNCPTKNHPYPDKTFWLKFLDIHDLCNLGVTPQRMWSITIHWQQTKHHKIRDVKFYCRLLHKAITCWEDIKASEQRQENTKPTGGRRESKYMSRATVTTAEQATATLTLFPDSHELQSQVLDPGEEANSAECSLICCWECSSAGGVVCSSELRARPKLRFLSLSPPPTHPPSHHIIISTNIWTSLRMSTTLAVCLANFDKWICKL